MNLKLPIYLDYAATTPVDEVVAEKMYRCMTYKGAFGNPHSQTHQFGWQASKLIETAREQVASVINAEPREIIWTSGATEANNLAIKGVAFYHNKGKHIITSQIEHKAVLEPCHYLEKLGFAVTFLPPETNGSIDPEQVTAHLRNDTVLVSLMHVNNETGAINDIATIGENLRKKNILFHVDAAQSAGKLPLDLSKLPVDLMSFSGHKMYGPKGSGVLFVRQKSKVNLVPLLHGGNQEWGIRSGTLATHQIVGIGEAFNVASQRITADNAYFIALRNQLWENIKNIEAIKLNSDLAQGAPHILNVSFKFIEGESLIMALKDIAVATGSACTSITLEPSYVLRAMGLQDDLAHGSIRFSFGRETTAAEIAYTGALICEKVAKLRTMSPLWDMYKNGIDIDSINWRKH